MKADPGSLCLPHVLIFHGHIDERKSNSFHLCWKPPFTMFIYAPLQQLKTIKHGGGKIPHT